MKKKVILGSLLLLILVIAGIFLLTEGELSSVDGVWRTDLSAFEAVPDENGWMEYELKNGEGRRLYYRNGVLVDAIPVRYTVQENTVFFDEQDGMKLASGEAFTWDRKGGTLVLSNEHAEITFTAVKREYPAYIGAEGYVDVESVYVSGTDATSLLLTEKDKVVLLELLRSGDVKEKKDAQLTFNEELYYIHLRSEEKIIGLELGDNIIGGDRGERYALSKLTEIRSYLGQLPRVPADPNNPAHVLAGVNADSYGLSLALSECVDPRLPEFDLAYADIEQAVNAEHFFAYGLKRMTWELTEEAAEQEFTEYEQPRRGMVLQGTDWYLSACEDDELVWFSTAAESGWYLPTQDGQIQDVYRILRQWYDEVEYDRLEKALHVPDSGQDALAAAKKYMSLSDALHLEVTEGSKYRYTYIKSEVTMDEFAQSETERLREQGRIGENEYCFSVKTVFVPENEATLMWGMAGNTVEYDGNDSKVPKDALQQWSCGIIAKENDEWKLTHLGSAW